MSATASPATPPHLPWTSRVAIFLRLLAIQGSWNYEVLLGNGVGFSIEPALRRLPGGRGGAAYREALARESSYFNAHPYLAGLAVGALARAELEGAPPDRIERFRTACCGPLGSVGDRLVWAGWLPLCSLLALVAFGLGGSPLLVVAAFLIIYNAGHLALRAWGFRAGWQHGLRVAAALGHPVLRQGPQHVTQVAAFVAGIALPLAIVRVTGPDRLLVGAVLAAATLGGIALARLKGRAEGRRVALLALAAYVLYSLAVSR